MIREKVRKIGHLTTSSSSTVDGARVFLLALATLLTSVSALADSTAQLQLSPLAKLLNGKYVSFNGPNCVNAALIGGGLMTTVMHVAPGTGEKLLPVCFVPAKEHTGAFGVISQNKSLIHMFYVANDTTIGAGTAFTKNGLEATAPYQLAPMDSVLDKYLKPGTELAYYDYRPSATCPLGAFQKFTESRADLKVISKSMVANTLANKWSGKASLADLQNLQRNRDALRDSSEPGAGLASDLLEAYSATPMFTVAWKVDNEIKAVDATVKATGLVPDVVRSRRADFERANHDLARVIAQSPFRNGDLGKLADRGQLKLSYFPSSREKMSVADLFIVCPLERADECFKTQNIANLDVNNEAAFEARSGSVLLRKVPGSRGLELELSGISYVIERVSLVEKWN